MDDKIVTDGRNSNLKASRNRADITDFKQPGSFLCVEMTVDLLSQSCRKLPIFRGP